MADDEFLIRWSLCQALSQEGYEVVSVEDGKKAMEAIRIQHFDYIVVDLTMPELDGWEVLDLIRRFEPATRVIVVTAYGEKDTEKIAKERGAWAYVEKPFIIGQIKDLLKEISGKESGVQFN
ncbi:MAG: response regulator [Thermodesulfobacteriota bacterium]